MPKWWCIQALKLFHIYNSEFDYFFNHLNQTLCLLILSLHNYAIKQVFTSIISQTVNKQKTIQFDQKFLFHSNLSINFLYSFCKHWSNKLLEQEQYCHKYGEISRNKSGGDQLCLFRTTQYNWNDFDNNFINSFTHVK